MEAIMYSDGGSRGNPGVAAIGAVIKDKDGKDIGEVSQFIGIQTNNVAEYTALIKGLERALQMGVKRITCYLDSQLVVKQVKGEYKTNNPRMAQLKKEVLDLKKRFRRFEIVHVKRHLNKEADSLVNEVLDLL